MIEEIKTVGKDTFYGVEYTYVVAFDKRRERFTFRVNRLAGDTDWCIESFDLPKAAVTEEINGQARAAAKAHGYAHFVQHLRVEIRDAALAAGMEWSEAVEFAHEVSFPSE